LALGFASATPGRLTGEALRLADETPGLAVIPVHLTWGDEHSRLLYGDVDLAFMAYPVATEFPTYEVIPMSRHLRGALLPAEHPLAARRQLLLEDIRDEPILDPGFAQDPHMHRDFWLANPRPGHPLPMVVGPPARAVEEMYAFVAAGKGMAIVSSVLPERYASPALAFVPITDLEPVEIGLVRLRDDSRRHVVDYAERMRSASELA
jgi:DNA-binding transcriptional LysR family regulator